MKTLFLILLAAASAVHIASLLYRPGVVKALSKACLAPLTLAIYAAGTDKFFPPVAAALVFGWIGDLLLLKNGDQNFFRLGLFSFLAGHLCYAFSLLYLAGSVDLSLLAVSLGAAAVLGIVARLFIRPSQAMSAPSAVYEAAILLMAIAAFQYYLFRGVPSGALAFAGSLCFMISDTILARFAFHTKPRYGTVPVMLFYIPAQLLLALGLS